MRGTGCRVRSAFERAFFGGCGRSKEKSSINHLETFGQEARSVRDRRDQSKIPKHPLLKPPLKPGLLYNYYNNKVSPIFLFY